MNLYTHLTINEREQIFHLINQGKSIRQVSVLLKRNQENNDYSPNTAQVSYRKRKLNCGWKLLLANSKLKRLIKNLFLTNQWSPEQISARLKMEKFIKQ